MIPVKKSRFPRAGKNEISVDQRLMGTGPVVKYLIERTVLVIGPQP